MISPKQMNFRKSSKRPLTPPLFSENHVVNSCKFHAQKALSKGLKSAANIFGLTMTSPPSLEPFLKFIRFGGAIRPL